MKIELDYFHDSVDLGKAAEEMRRVATMIDEGYTSGELVSQEGCRGWWAITGGEDAQ